MRKGLDFHTVEQNSPEWFKLRTGKVTGSTAAPLLVDAKMPAAPRAKSPTPEKLQAWEDACRAELDKTKGLGVGAWALIDHLAGCLASGRNESSDYEGYWMTRGKDLEPVARREYQNYTFRPAHEVGFVEWCGRLAGCSPDFMVDEQRGGEIKCLSIGNHVNFFRTRYISPDHYKQIQWCLFITGFKYWDLVLFHPHAGRQQILIETVERDAGMIAKYAERFDIVETQILELSEKLTV